MVHEFPMFLWFTVNNTQYYHPLGLDTFCNGTRFSSQLPLEVSTRSQDVFPKPNMVHYAFECSYNVHGRTVGTQYLTHNLLSTVHSTLDIGTFHTYHWTLKTHITMHLLLVLPNWEGHCTLHPHLPLPIWL